MIENFYVENEVVELINEFEKFQKVDSPVYLICRDCDKHLVMNLEFLNNTPMFHIIHYNKLIVSSDRLNSSNVNEVYKSFKKYLVDMEV